MYACVQNCTVGVVPGTRSRDVSLPAWVPANKCSQVQESLPGETQHSSLERLFHITLPWKSLIDSQEGNEIYSEFLKAQKITECDSPTEPLEAESKLL